MALKTNKANQATAPKSGGRSGQGYGKRSFTPAGLRDMGFNEVDGDTLEDGGKYRVFDLVINEHTLSATLEYDADDECSHYYFELNGELLQGERTITRSDITILKQIL